MRKGSGLHTEPLAKEAQLDHPQDKAEKAKGDCDLDKYIKIHVGIVVHRITAI